NGVNELIIDTLPRAAFLFRPPFWHRWTAAVADTQGLSVPEPVRELIDVLTAKTPFCFKDPRFSYTLPVWRPSLKNVVYVCVFRDPAITAGSIVNEVDAVRTAMGIPTRITYEQAVTAWTAMYKHILAMPCDGPEWLFVHYEQVLNGSALKKMEATTGAALD